MYRTDIGESPESDPVAKNQLFNICQSQGDSKGSLKFLVMQTSVLPSPSSAVVPPPTGHNLAHGPPGHSLPNQAYMLGSPADLSRKTFSASSASGIERYRAGQAGSRHSRSGSVSSQSEKMGRHDYLYGNQDSALETSPVDITQMPNASNYTTQGPPIGGNPSSHLSRHHRVMSKSGRRVPSASTGTSRGSQSPADEKTKAAAMRYYASPPQSLDTNTSGTHTSTTSIPTAAAFGSGMYRADGFQAQGKRGNTTPTMQPWPQPDYQPSSQHPFLPNPSRSSFDSSLPVQREQFSPGRPMVESPDYSGDRNPADRMYDNTVDWEPSPSEPTEADLLLIHRMQAEEEEKARQQRRQMEEDMRVALQEQQKEHEAWEAMQHRERDVRDRQIETDRLAAERAIEQDRRTVDGERERAERSRREAEIMERERERQVGRERKARRLQWENKVGSWNAGMPYLHSDSSTNPDASTRPSIEPNFGSSSASSSHSRHGNLAFPSAEPRSRPEGLPESYSRGPAQTFSEAATYSPYISQPRYDIAQASLPPGATYGYMVESAQHDQGRDRSQHSQSGPVPQLNRPLRPGRDYNSAVRSATSQVMPDARPYQPHSGPHTYAGPIHATSHPPYDYDNSYRADLARLRAVDAEHPAAYNYNQEYPAQSMPVPQLAFPEPQPFLSTIQDRRGSHGNVSPYSNGSSTVSSRRASISQTPVYRSDHQTTAGNASTYMGPPSAQPLSALSGHLGSYIDPSAGRDQDATMMPGTLIRRDSEPEDDSGNTARAHEWANQLNSMMEGQHDGTLTQPSKLPNLQSDLDQERPVEEGEETLFFVPLGLDQGTEAPSVRNDITVMPQKPPLQVDTHTSAVFEPEQPSASSTDPSESATTLTSESDAILERSGGTNLKRAKSFAKTKDQWNFRPPAEDVYDRLEEFFPKIDLDKPVVSNPVVEAPAEATSPKTEIVAVPRPSRPAGFNKADARKSIRFVAEGRKRHLSKIAPMEKLQPSTTSNALKRTSSMWGHKVVEVTASGLKDGKLPPITQEGAAPGVNCKSMSRNHLTRSKCIAE